MTGKDGKKLPECDAQLRFLEATGQAMNTAFGEMQKEFRLLRDDMYTQRVSIGTLTGNVKQLTDNVDRLNNMLDTKIDKAIAEHEENCVFSKVAKKKQERDITKSLKIESSSIPPTEITKNLKKLPKKAQAVIYICLAIGGAIATVVGYFS